MKAIVRDEYGTPEVLRFEDVPKPIPGDDDVLVEVRAASINTADLDHLRGSPLLARIGTGLRRPRTRVPGFDVAGTVEAVGTGVTRFRRGDDVWADLFSNGGGAFAEYVCAPQSAFLHKPAGLTYEQAAALPHSGLLALQAVSARGGIEADDKVLINGAGGCVGPFAVQIARSLGAEVTGVDHGDKLDMITSLGADHVIDYTREDFARSGRRYDFILDIAANRWVPAHWRALEPGGAYVQIARSIGGFFQAAMLGGLISLASDRRMGLFTWAPNRETDMERLGELVNSGQVTPLVDRRYPLSAVADGLRYQQEGRARGKLVVTD